MRSTPEVEWDDAERALMLALDRYESLVHPPCGGYLPETTDPAMDDGWVPDAAIRCHRCTALALAAKQYESSPEPAALLIRVKRRGGGRHH